MSVFVVSLAIINHAKGTKFSSHVTAKIRFFAT